MDTVYLVSSVHRSGSSMAMRCLEAAGLTAVYDPQADIMNNTLGDYVPNPNGFYQFSGPITPTFFSDYSGKLLKCYIKDLPKLPQGNYKLLLLKRNPAEIRASMSRWTPFSSWGEDEAVTYLYDFYMDELVRQLTERGDFDITILYYADIVKDPTTEFNKLFAASWPIDVSKAAELVDPSLHRLKLELQ